MNNCKWIFVALIAFACTGAFARDNGDIAPAVNSPESAALYQNDAMEPFEIAEIAECQCGCYGFPQSWAYAQGTTRMQACSIARANMPMNCAPISCQ